MPALRDVSRGAGHNLLALDADGVARRCIPFVRVGDATIPALAVEGAIEALGLHMSDVRFDADGFWLGDRLVPLAASEAPTLDGGTRVVPAAAHRLPGRVAGPAADLSRRTRSRSCFNPRNSCWQARKPTSIPRPSTARSSSSARRPPGSTTRRPCPFAQKMSGPEIHANVVDSILSGRFIDAGRAVHVGAADARRPRLVIACIVVLVGTWPGVISALVVAAGLVFGLTSLFGKGTWVPLVEPLLAVTLAAFGGVTYQYFVEGREKRRVKRLFSRYVSKDVYQQLLDESRRRAARRHAAAHDGALLRHPRLHGRVRARRSPRPSSRS